MSPILAVALVAILVGLLSLVRWCWPGRRSGVKQFVGHIWQSVLCGFAVWLLNLFMGWGPVHELDAILAGLGVLFTVGLGLGFLAALLLYFEECKAAFALYFLNSATTPRPRLKSKIPASAESFDKPRPVVKKAKIPALPLPDNAARLDWCDECERWHSAQANHEHNLVG